MRVFFALAASALFALWALTPVSRSAPIGGAEEAKVEVPAGGLAITKRFRGGERASVHVNGDHKDVTTVLISVHDDKDKLVAEDKGRDLPIGDIGAVVWFPPRDGDYRITVRNVEGRAAKYVIAIR
jgi:hypothetical protein